MSIKRITLSVPEELAAKIKKIAGDKSVSAYVTKLIENDIAEEEAAERFWERYFAEMPPNPEVEAWAETAIERLKSRPAKPRVQRRIA